MAQKGDFLLCYLINDINMFTGIHKLNELVRTRNSWEEISVRNNKIDETTTTAVVTTETTDETAEPTDETTETTDETTETTDVNTKTTDQTTETTEVSQGTLGPTDTTTDVTTQSTDDEATPDGAGVAYASAVTLTALCVASMML